MGAGHATAPCAVPYLPDGNRRAFAAALLAFRVYINPFSSWRHFAFGATIAVALTLIMNLLTLAIILATQSREWLRSRTRPGI